jgi:hypothetical protein
LGGLQREACVTGACYRWLGKTLAVLSDGEFDCGRLDGEGRRECEAGARTSEEPLVTFS